MATLYEELEITIPRAVSTRCVEAIAKYLSENETFFRLCGGVGVEGEDGYVPPRIYMFPFDERQSDVSMAPSPRQLHVYEGACKKEPGIGSGEWPTAFEIHFEYYAPLSRDLPVFGGVTMRDELKYLSTLMWIGEASRTPGRFRDPDNAGKMISTGIILATIDGPAAGETLGVSRDDLTVIFRSSETATGQRNGS